MNIHNQDVLFELSKKAFVNQRLLSEKTGYSLGKINQSLKQLITSGYLTDDMKLTSKANTEIDNSKPTNAIILAAGFGMRMIPINKEVPKGLLNVHNEVLIERIINHLHEVGIYKIDIVVGFKKEKFEYLIDKYNINLLVNEEYVFKNNIHSLYLAQDLLSNTYIIPSDIYCESNPFSTDELYSWYSVTEKEDSESTVRVNRKKELVSVSKQQSGNKMIGIAYVFHQEAQLLKKNLRELYLEKKNHDLFWEEALMDQGKMIVKARVASSISTYELNTYEQLRELDEHSLELKSDVISLIATIFNTQTNNIKNITVLKKGMTNHSFKFEHNDKYYIMRIPGKGTDMMINRFQEYNVYQVIKNYELSDNIVYIDPKNGYKISEYLEEAKVCDPSNGDDVKQCIDQLKVLHNLKIEVDHTFDVFYQIEYYESLRNNVPSIYDDYLKTKTKLYELKEYIDLMPKEWVLTHIDAVPDNFLLINNEVRLIDWEYAGMQDPHIDIAMFAIYALYDKAAIDRLIDVYFTNGCTHSDRVKIYCYVAVCGLLWSNWCEFKRSHGFDFGEYALRQYRYAKDYYTIAKKEMKKEGQA